MRLKEKQTLGFVLASREQDVTVVDDVFAVGLAASAGLKAEDRIVAVNGFAVVGMPHEDIIQLLIAQLGVDLIILRAGPLSSDDDAGAAPTTFVASVQERGRLSDKSKSQKQLSMVDVQAVREQIGKKGNISAQTSSSSFGAASDRGYRTEDDTVHTESAL
jgi:C-terminal processing protease CtpA/Prc